MPPSTLKPAIIPVTGGRLRLPGGGWVPCASGSGGAGVKWREGDGVTPVGAWTLRRALFRPDRVAPPATALPVAPLRPDDGWCDDPAHPNYNRPVRLPFAAGCERLWRDDHLYDVIVPLGFNDAPPAAGRGSAIFLHVAAPDWRPTAGCVALRPADLLRLLAVCGPGAALAIGP